jgi:hypothetical protein
MNVRSDIEVRLDAWVQEGPTRLAGPALESALRRVAGTTQRRTLRGPFGLAPAWSLGRSVLAAGLAGLVVVGALLGAAAIGVLSGGPLPSPEPSPRAAEPGPLAEGARYAIDQPVSVSFTVPAGWVYGGPDAHIIMLSNTELTAWILWSAWPATDNMYRDPCHWQQGELDPPLGPSVDDLAGALAELPGFVTAGPTQTTLGGLPAKEVSLAPTTITGCDQDQMKLATSMPTTPGGVPPTDPTVRAFQLSHTYLGLGGSSTITIVEVSGSREVMVSWTSMADRAATDDVLAIEGSVRFP